MQWLWNSATKALLERGVQLKRGESFHPETLRALFAASRSISDGNGMVWNGMVNGIHKGKAIY